VKGPLEAQQGAGISAGVLLSLATILLFDLVRPKRFNALAKQEEANGEERRLKTPLTA